MEAKVKALENELERARNRLKSLRAQAEERVQVFHYFVVTRVNFTSTIYECEENCKMSRWKNLYVAVHVPVSLLLIDVLTNRMRFQDLYEQ